VFRLRVRAATVMMCVCNLARDLDGTDLNQWFEVRVVGHVTLQDAGMGSERCQKLFQRVEEIMAQGEVRGLRTGSATN